MNAAEIKMSVSKESEFKLFGKTIALPEKNRIPVKSVTGCQNPDKSELMDACSETTKAESEEDTTAAECDGKPNKCYNFGNHKEEEEQTVTLMQETHLNPKPKEDQVETNSRDRDQEEGFKRPDKILQCPRCHSCDTKFCYFNNYNVNQPRHYCKNCQRYWTAGGAMRKVAFGAGRRKNKHLASQYSLVMVSSDAVPTSGTESSYSANHQLLAYEESTTTLLKIGSEAPFSESMERLPNLIGQKRCADNGSVNVREKGEEPSSSGSSMTASSLLEQNLHEKNLHKEQVGLQGSCNTFPPPHPFSCYPVPSWALPWNPNATHMAAASCSSESVYTPESYKSNSVQWGSTPMMAVPGLHNPSIPLQFVPTSYPGCMPIWPGNRTGIINLAAGANGCSSPSSSTTNSCSGNGSPTLGKHSRDVNTFDDEKIGKVYCGSTINYPNK